jgi:hypothetical protein
VAHPVLGLLQKQEILKMKGRLHKRQWQQIALDFLIDSDTSSDECSKNRPEITTQAPQAPQKAPLVSRTSCYDAYLEAGNCKPMMLAMCCGVMNGKWKITELDEEPYATLLKKVKLKQKVNKKFTTLKRLNGNVWKGESKLTNAAISLNKQSRRNSTRCQSLKRRH